MNNLYTLRRRQGGICFVAPQLQSRGGYVPSSRLAFAAMALAPRCKSYSLTGSYDIRDRVMTNEGPNGVVTSMVYDNADRVLMETYPDGGVEQFQYSALGLIATTNQLGKVTTFGYDSAGRKIAETNEAMI